jgi:hypothetical protein
MCLQYPHSREGSVRRLPHQQLIWTTQQTTGTISCNLSYWMSNRSHITSIAFLQNYLKYKYKFLYFIHISVDLGMHCLPSVAHCMLLIQTIWKKKKKKCKPKLVNVFLDNKATAQIGTNVNAGLLASSQFASGRSCYRPTR